MKGYRIAIMIILVCFLFAGCESSERLTNMTVIQAVGIDTYEDNDETKVSVQYLNLSKNASTTEALQGNITDTASGTASSISDAIAETSKTLSREMFFGQNKVIVFGADYAKKDIDKGLDYLLRSIDSRPDVVIAMSVDSAQSVIENKERSARVPAESVYKLLKLGEKNGLGAVVTVNDLLNLYNDDTSDIYLPVIKSEKEFVTCKGVAVFSNSHYALTLDENQTFGFLFVKNKIDGGALIVKNTALGSVGLEINSSKSKRSVSVDVKNGKITFECDIRVNLILNEIEKGITNSIDENTLKDIEKLVDKKVKDMAYSAVSSCLEAKSDPFMIGRYLAQTDEEFYNTVKDDWQKQLPDIEVKIKVSSAVQRINSNFN